VTLPDTLRKQAGDVHDGLSGLFGDEDENAVPSPGTLQQFVTKAVLPAAIRQFMPLVEIDIDIDISNPLDRGQAGKTVGTANPASSAGQAFRNGRRGSRARPTSAQARTWASAARCQFFLDEDLLTRPRGRPSHTPLDRYRSFQY